MGRKRVDRNLRRKLREHRMRPEDMFDGTLRLPRRLWPKVTRSRSQGKHWVIVVEFLDEKKRFVLARSPSDHRSMLNRRSDIRRWVRSVLEQRRRDRRGSDTVAPPA